MNGGDAVGVLWVFSHLFPVLFILPLPHCSGCFVSRSGQRSTSHILPFPRSGLR